MKTLHLTEAQHALIVKKQANISEAQAFIDRERARILGVLDCVLAEKGVDQSLSWTLSEDGKSLERTEPPVSQQ